MAVTPQAAAQQLLVTLRRMNSQLQKATACMQTLHVTESRAEDSAMLIHIHNRDLSATLTIFKGQMPMILHDGTLDWMGERTPPATNLHALGSRSIAAFTAAISAIMSAMQKLDATLPQQPHIASAFDAMVCDGLRLSEVLFDFFITLSDAFNAWSFFLTSPLPMDTKSLQPVLSACIAWFGSFVRRNSAMYRQLLVYAGAGRMFQRSLYPCIRAAVVLLCAMIKLPTAENPRACSSLAPGFLSSLCCLACDMTPVPGTPLSPFDYPEDPEDKEVIHVPLDILSLLQRALFGCNFQQRKTSKDALAVLSKCVCLAALEVSKRVVSIHCTTPGIPLQHMMEAQRSLIAMLQHSLPAVASSSILPPLNTKHGISVMSGSGSGSSGGSNSDTNSSSTRCDTRPHDSNSATVPCHLTPDRYLLSLLAECSLSHPQSLLQCTMTMNAIVRVWRQQSKELKLQATSQ